MLYYGRIEITEGLYINKTSASNKYDIWNYWYFLGNRLMFQPYVCNGCYYLLILKLQRIDFNAIEITTFLGNTNISKILVSNKISFGE